MKIIILAAGKGERLYPLTRNLPKPLLDIGNGKTLLEEQIERIQASGVIDEIILVVGYLAEQIDSKIIYYQSRGIKIKTVFNPFYDISNNLLSLWFAKEEMTDSFLITNGDNLFSKDVFENFVKMNKQGIFFSISRKRKYDDDDMKVTIFNNYIDHVSKNIPIEKADAESPGLVLVDGSKSVNIVKTKLENLIRKPNHRNSFWLELINSLVEDGVHIQTWEFDGANEWQEVDIHPDIEKMKQLIEINIKKQ